MRGLRRSTLALLLLWSGVALGAQGDVEIVHDPIECWPVDEFLLVQSSFVPPEDIQTVKFYFRSLEHPDYYYVELTLGRDGGRAIAPKAAASTSEVSCYMEVVTRGFSAFRTEERVIPVASGSECKRRDPGAAFYTGQNPDIAVGATRLGATPLPPGFQADGIARFLSATGISGEAAAGGGIGGKTVGVIAGAGGGAAALFLLGGNSDSTTTSPVGGITTTSPSTSATSTAIGGVTSTTTTAGGGGNSTSSATTTITGGGGGSTTTVFGSTTTSGGSTTTVGGSSTTTSSGSSTTTSIGSSTTTSVGTSSSTSSVGSTTTSPPTTTTSVPPTTTTAPSTTSVGCPADVFPEVTDTPDPIVANGTNQLTYSIRVRNAGPNTATAVSVTVTQAPPGSQAGQCPSGCAFNDVAPGGVSETKTGRYTIPAGTSGTVRGRVRASAAGCDANPGNDEVTVITTATSSLRFEEGKVAFTYRSQMSLERDGLVGGRIVLNDGNPISVDAGGLHQVSSAGQIGKNTMEATLNTPSPGGRWHFNFESTQGFVGGSIHVEAGQTLSVGSRDVVFSVGPAGAPVRFTFELERSR